MSKLTMIFGARLKAIREAQGLTQERLAQQVRIAYKFLGALERGVKAPSFAVVERLSHALKVDPYQLFLPEDHSAVELEGEIRAVAAGLRRSQRERIAKLLQEILRAAKKLDV